MISIIIPVYNAEKTIERCIISVLQQSFSDFELILINDGSQDESEKICQTFKNFDKRILYIKKENGGVSSARNKGISVARGDYITFVDSDDYIEKDYLQHLMMNSNSDLVLSGFNSSEGIIYVPKATEINELNQSEFIPQIVSHEYLLYTPWSKLFKRNILVEENINFDESLRLYEDTIFVLTYLSYCRTVSVIPYSDYQYIGVWGGISKYTLSQLEVEYRCKVEYDVLTRLETSFNCYIDKQYRCFAINYLDNLYAKFTDRYCVDLYRRYHSEEETRVFLNNIYYFPTYGAIYKLRNTIMGLCCKDAINILKNLHHFFNISSKELNFRKISERFIYILIKEGHLKTTFLLLKGSLLLKSIFKDGKKQ